MRKKGGLSIIAFTLLVSLLSGCTSGGGGLENGVEAAKPVMEDEGPVELTLYNHWLGNSDDYLNKIIGEMVHKKYPNIIIKVLMGDNNGPKLDELLAQGTMPDIIYAAQSYAPLFRDDYKVVEDMSPYIKAGNLDLNRFEPTVMNAIKSYGKKGEIYGLPLVMSPWALYYNKDIFDKFGVPYPVDGMTWDEVIELARKLTRDEGGTQYKGIALQMIDKMALQLSLPYVDPQTSKPAISSDGWKRLFEQMKKVWDIPNLFTGAKDITAYGEFETKKTVAMVTNNNKIPNYVKEEQNGLRWDVVEFPSYPDKMHLYPAVEANTLMLSAGSKHKDAAFKVIKYLVSDEVQMALAKTAQMSALTGGQFQKAFGQNYPSLKNKNIQGIYKGHPAPLTPASKYNEAGLKAVRDSWKNVLVNNQDLNSALREADENLQQAINDLRLR